MNVYFSEDAYRALEEVTTRSGKSLTDAVAEAIKLSRYVSEIRVQGGHIFVETASGSVRELLIL